ncbi:MAG TPA: AcvB/VirJ family lysyl-phosphatidylglycerol hydrolase [Gemmatimonadales bacterium]|jgi:type IV secretory pathway VirJ component
MLCVSGGHQSDTLGPDLPAGLAKTVRLEGTHHSDGDHRGKTRLILDRAK